MANEITRLLPFRHTTRMMLSTSILLLMKRAKRVLCMVSSANLDEEPVKYSKELIAILTIIHWATDYHCIQRTLQG